MDMMFLFSWYHFLFCFCFVWSYYYIHSFFLCIVLFLVLFDCLHCIDWTGRWYYGRTDGWMDVWMYGVTKCNERTGPEPRLCGELFVDGKHTIPPSRVHCVLVLVVSLLVWTVLYTTLWYVTLHPLSALLITIFI